MRGFLSSFARNPLQISLRLWADLRCRGDQSGDQYLALLGHTLAVSVAILLVLWLAHEVLWQVVIGVRDAGIEPRTNWA